MITLCSIFRNSENYIDRYFQQVDALRDHMDVRLVLAEGDSDGDMSWMLLGAHKDPDDIVIKVNHGGPVFGSVDHPDRWQQIGHVVRSVLKQVRDPGDTFVWVESDLIWDVSTMVRLIEADMPVCPMVFSATQPERLYDTWGARQGGRLFLGSPPYFPDGPPTSRYVKVDSCGSCFVVPAKDYEVVYGWDGIWPFAAAGRLHMDTESTIWHP